MQIDSLLRSINKRLSEYAEAFGGVTSFEYMWAKTCSIQSQSNQACLLERLRTVLFLLAEVKDDARALRKRRSFRECVTEMWNKLKERGTVKHIIETEYLNQPGVKEFMEENDLTIKDIMNDTEFIEQIWEESAYRADKAYNDSEISDSNPVDEQTDEVIDSNLPQDIKDELINDLASINKEFYRSGKGIADEKWDNIQRMWKEFIYKKERYYALMADETEPE